jgi:glycosyltransferase involved in cell wall biosynthesis
MKNITVTIGIPAFNEEANIGYLLKDLLKQKEVGFELTKIIVASDGSSDKTVQIVRGLKNRKIVAIDNKDRIGAAGRQNQLCRMSKSDYLLLLNADTLIVDREFIVKLVNKAKITHADLISANLQELKPESFFEKVLATSMKLKKDSFQSFRKGNNIYTCYGPARLFSKKLYQQIQFGQSYGEDAFSYLFCLRNAMKYAYAQSALVYYKLPSSLSDHKKQSYRFIESQKRMINEFGFIFTVKEYYLPYSSVLLTLPSFFFRNPFYTTVYLLLFVYSSFGGLLNVLTKNVIQTWDVSASTKQLRRSSI